MKSPNQIDANAQAFEDNYLRFAKVFRKPLHTFYTPGAVRWLFGFDTFKFEREVAQPRKKESVADATKRKYGDEGLAILLALHEPKGKKHG